MKNKIQNSKGLFMTLLIALLSGYCIQAQQLNPPNHDQGPPPLPDSVQIVRMVDELDMDLSLSELQKTKTLNMHLAHFEKARQLTEQDRISRETNREAMENHRKEFENQMMALFNKQQKVKFEEIIKKHKRPPHHGEKWFKY